MKYSLNIEKSCIDFLESLDKKQFRQITLKILKLLSDPYPPDSIKLKGVDQSRRVDQGEFRILYVIDNVKREIQIWKIGKRDSGEVYRHIT
jgi:mRNA interferase RelE/StbE